MGMIGNYYRANVETVSRIKTGELSLNKLIYEDDNGNFKDNYWENEQYLCIEKDWHIIHFVLSGQVWDSTDDPLSKVIPGFADEMGKIMSGSKLNDEDMGYGHAVYLMPMEVQDVSYALKNVAKEWFCERFFTADMVANDIYIGANITKNDEEFEFVYSAMPHIIEFYEKAAIENQCVIFFVN